MGKIWLFGLLEPLQKTKQETGTKSATREGPFRQQGRSAVRKESLGTALPCQRPLRLAVAPLSGLHQYFAAPSLPP